MPTRVLMTGNEALAEGAIRGGCDAYFGYPITPQNELTAYMSRRMPENGRVFIQSESELAAINMVFGAAAAGKRALTTSSSPGISLKQEGISYMAGCMLPAVIANIQRGGPGLGGIEPAQGDYFQATRGGGHGDYHTIVIAPYSAQEMHDSAFLAFDLAERYRIQVMLLADGMLGQMMEPVVLREFEPWPNESSKPWALTGAEGREPNVVRSLFVKEGELEEHNLELQAVYERVRQNETAREVFGDASGGVLVVAWGGCARIARGAVAQARESGLKAGLFRPINLWPFPYRALAQAADCAKSVLVVEMNEGQMLQDVMLAVLGARPVRFKGFLGSRIPRESEIIGEIKAMGA